MFLKRAILYFMRRLVDMDGIPYLEPLAILNLETLELRRLKIDIYMYHKIIHNNVALSVDDFFHFDDRQLTSIRSYDPNNLVKPMITSLFIQQDFCVRCVDAWNSIPIAVHNIETNGAFKIAVNSIDLSRFLIGTYSVSV